MGEWSIDPRLLEFGTSFTPLMLYPWGKSPPPRTHRPGGGGGARAGLDDMENRKPLILPGLEHRPFSSPARSQSPYRLSYRALFQMRLKRM
jgi:hypothetical protein